MKDGKPIKKSATKKMLYGFLVFTILVAGLFIFLLRIDARNASEGIGENLKFDWISAGCSLGAMFASVYLGLVATKQNEKANEQNERLAKLNEKQLENAILSQGHPQIRFSKVQRLNGINNTLNIRIIDVRDVVLKKAYTREIQLQPLSEKYKEDEKAEKIKVHSNEIKSDLQLTYLHEDINKSLYMIDVPIKKEVFDSHRFYRLEFETDVISVTGIVSRNKCFALIDTNYEYSGMKDRDYFEVYHQFFEVKEILSEEKYNRQRMS